MHTVYIRKLIRSISRTTECQYEYKRVAQVVFETTLLIKKIYILTNFLLIHLPLPRFDL